MLSATLSAAQSVFRIGDGGGELKKALVQRVRCPKSNVSVPVFKPLIIECTRAKSSSTWRSRQKTVQRVLSLPYNIYPKKVRSKELVLRLAKSYRGRKTHRTARDRVAKALKYAYRDRRVKKREFRKLWISRINAGARQYGMSYCEFMYGLRAQRVDVNRKYLSNMVILVPETFKRLAESTKKYLDEHWQKKRVTRVPIYT